MVASQTRSKNIVLSIFLVLLVATGFWLVVAKVQSSNAPPTVKIGLIAPFEGLYRSTGYEMLFAVKLALQARNQGRGLNGYRVELVALNDFNQPEEAYRQARALVADPAVLGVIGHFTTDSTRAALPVYQEAQLATVIPWSFDASIFVDRVGGVVSVAATLQETAAYLETISRAMGFKQPARLTNNDVSTLPDQIQAVQLATDPVTAGNIILALQGLNLKPQLFGRVNVGDRQLVQVAGASANGLILVSPGPGAADVSKKYRPFVEAYKKMAGFPPGPRAFLAYDATNVLLDSIEQAMISAVSSPYHKPPSRAEVSRRLTLVQSEGITGKITFDTLGQRVNAPIWGYQISEARYPGTVIVP